MRGYHNFSIGKVFHDFFKVSKVVLCCVIEFAHDWVFIAFFFGQSSFFDYVSSSDEFSSEDEISSFSNLDFIIAPLNWSFQIIL